MTALRYRAYGTVFESSIPLTGFTVVEAEPDVVIARGAVPPKLEAVTASGPLWTANPSEVLFQPDGLRYLVRRGTVTVDESATAVGVETYLQGVTVAASMMMLGKAVLHGAASDIDGGSVLFIGKNGAGKSSTAAALSAAGGRPICDNLAVVDDLRGTLFLHPGPASIRLWTHMASELGVALGEAPRVLPEMEKYIIPVDRRGDAPSRVRAIVSVTAADIEAPSLARLAPIDAFTEVTRLLFRGRLARMLDPSLQQTISALTRQVPVYALQRPVTGWGPRVLAAFVRTGLQKGLAR